MSALPTVESVLAILAARGVTLPPGRVTTDGYGDSAELSAELLELIRSGRKRAGTGLLWAMEADGDRMPAVGDIEIVLDFHNEPVLVTRIISVEIKAYDQVDADYAATEGEGDGSLEYWRWGHWNFFGRECARIGRQPSPDMPVVCCVIELLAEIPPAPDAAPFA